MYALQGYGQATALASRHVLAMPSHSLAPPVACVPRPPLPTRAYDRRFHCRAHVKGLASVSGYNSEMAFLQSPHRAVSKRMAQYTEEVGSMTPGEMEVKPSGCTQ